MVTTKDRETERVSNQVRRYGLREREEGEGVNGASVGFMSLSQGDIYRKLPPPHLNVNQETD